MKGLLVDLRTLIFLLGMGNLIVAVLMAAYGWTQIQRRPVFHLVFARLAQSAAWLLLWQRDQIPYLLSFLVGNLLLVTGWAMEGMAVASAGPGRWRFLRFFTFAFPLTILVTCADYFVQSPNLVIALATFNSVILLLPPSLMLAVEKGASTLQRVVGGFYLLFCATCMGRVVDALTASRPMRLMTASPMQTLTFVMVFALMVFGGMGYLLMLKEKTDKELMVTAFKFNRLFQDNPALMVVSDPGTHRLLDVNEAFVRVLGYSRAEALGHTGRELGLFAEMEQMERMVEQVRMEGRMRDAEMRIRARDGSILDGMISAETIEISGERLFLAVMVDITERKRAAEEREKAIRELQLALDQIRTLRGLIPICASCKRIRNDEGFWQQVESYVSAHTEARFSHGVCPECMARLYPELGDMDGKGGGNA